MRKAEKLSYIMTELDRLFPDPPIPLDHRDPYTLLIAVLLSAQCTDVRVNKVTPQLFARADTPQAMIGLSREEIEEIIRPCGLAPMKSKGIYELSHILLDQHHGQVPADMKALEALPAVGHKTASVVLSQGFGLPAFPVDTHIHRMLYRWNLSNGKSVAQTEKDAKRLFPEERWHPLHLQIIFYARAYSPARAWDIHKDFITYRVGRRSLLRQQFPEVKLPE